jgi:hypothetical protein
MRAEAPNVRNSERKVGPGHVESFAGRISPTTSAGLDALAATLRRYADELEREALPTLVGELEAARAYAWARLVAPTTPMLQTEPLLTAEELAPVIKLPVHAVRDRARRGIIPSVPVGRYVRFQASAVIAALKGEPRSAHPVARKSARTVKQLDG